MRDCITIKFVIPQLFLAARKVKNRRSVLNECNISFCPLYSRAMLLGTNGNALHKPANCLLQVVCRHSKCLGNLILRLVMGVRPLAINEFKVVKPLASKQGEWPSDGIGRCDRIGDNCFQNGR